MLLAEQNYVSYSKIKKSPRNVDVEPANSFVTKNVMMYETNSKIYHIFVFTEPYDYVYVFFSQLNGFCTQFSIY